MDSYTLIIIGGGPSGLFCAYAAGRELKNVLLIESKPSCGRKLLMSGSGQCNITHDGEVRSFLSHYGDNGAFLKPALMSFTNQDLMNFFSENGVELTRYPGGKVFPASRQASDLLQVLEERCRLAGVRVITHDPALEACKKDDAFLVKTASGYFQSDHLVIATGGITYPATGSTGDGYRFAQKFGHQIAEVAPALAAVLVKDYQFSDLSGISFPDLSISLYRGEKKIRDHVGDILFTHSGLSGPGILDFSRFIRPGDQLKVSFLPGKDMGTVSRSLIDQISAAGNRQVKTVLTSYSLPDRFIRKLLELSGIEPDLTGSHLSKKERSILAGYLTGFPFTVLRLSGPEDAMVTRGGVTLTEINQKTLESKLVPGLYFIGEVLDIDGDTGGYNLQAAFSTAALAARSIISKA
ncbi:MAG TPA: NAD(P)/FAD-dependent oxidoreductase [Methanospirillum sp.]|nr:NAD(P)/FAD-dependent oxidoreductase [Methanospirillum sp.]